MQDTYGHTDASRASSSLDDGRSDAARGSAATFEDTLAPLITTMGRLDDLRLKLEREGGSLSDLEEMTAILEKGIRMSGRTRPWEIALTRPGEIHAFLDDISYFRLHLQVRRRENGLPVYYLARVHRDYWDAYALVVEEYYLSPGYPFRDRRFVKLMDVGRETYHLCLAPFRAGARALLAQPEPGGPPHDAAPGPVPAWKVDALLYHVGRNVLQAAWHEDQEIGVLAADHFGLPGLKQAIELLYLCLSGDLCELRSAVSDVLCAFFRHVYPQPAICRFLQILPAMPGKTLNDLSEERSKKLYDALMKAFKRFLNVEVAWGHRRQTVPLYKLIFANLSRLDHVAPALRSDRAVEEACEALEASAQRILDDLLLPPRLLAA